MFPNLYYAESKTCCCVCCQSIIFFWHCSKLFEVNKSKIIITTPSVIKNKQKASSKHRAKIYALQHRVIEYINRFLIAA